MRDLRGPSLFRATAVGLLVGTALLTGCSSRTEANDTLPPVTAAPTTEAELPPLGPSDMPMPAAAREQTSEGADAFTSYYVDIYNHALRTLDTTYMRELSSGCDTCDQLADQIDRVATAGQEYEGGQVRVVGSTPPLVEGKEAQLVFDIVQAPLSVTINGVAVEGQATQEFSSTGGGGILSWDDKQASWVMRQWNAS